jgi:hypothetical protein
MDDVGDTGELYQYLNEAIIPAFINPLDDTPRVDKDRVHRYSQLIGGLQIMQTRRKRKNCGDTYPGLGPFNELQRNPFLDKIFCFPPDSRDTECFGEGGKRNPPIPGYCPDVQEAEAKSPSKRRLFDLAGAWGNDFHPQSRHFLPLMLESQSIPWCSTRGRAKQRHCLSSIDYGLRLTLGLMIKQLGLESNSWC